MASPPIEIRLRDYLAGHVLRQALLQFERAMGPWVKEQMQLHVGESPDDTRRLADHAAGIEARAKEIVKAQKELPALEQKIRDAPKAERNASAAEKKRLTAQLKRLRKEIANLPPPPQPKWIEVCREPFGRLMKPHVTVEAPWDAHTIVVVMRAFLPEVFERHLKDGFHAKEMLTQIWRVAGARNRRAHRVQLIEADVLDSLSQILSVLEQCGACTPPAAAAATVVKEVLDKSKALVERARQGYTNESLENGLTAAEINEQRFFEAVTLWESHVEREVECELHYQDGTIAFGKNLDDKWTSTVQNLKMDFQDIASARHWYFHHIAGPPPDLSKIYETMSSVIATLATVGKSANFHNWAPPIVHSDSVSGKLILDLPSTRMTVPVARVREIVGRDSTVDQATSLVVGDSDSIGTRVLIHGDAGVGKDTVMAEVAAREEIQALEGLQGWLQASSDEVFRRQLIALFSTHRPAVVAAAQDNADAALASITQWLAREPDWVLFVEDASVGSTTLWNILPLTLTHGRVLITSQHLLHKEHTEFQDAVMHLEPISTVDSLTLLRRMSLFEKKTSPPPENECEEDLRNRCESTEVPECYIAAPPNEKSARRKERRKQIEIALHEHMELNQPALRSFLEETLGNLPLSVSLCGHMFRADPGMERVGDLISKFKAVTALATVDQKGRNPQQDKHYFGLARSIEINLQRLQAAADVPELERSAALMLLAAMSVLHRTLTPASLFTGHNGDDFLRLTPCYCPSNTNDSHGHRCYSSLHAFSRAAAALYGDGAMFKRAIALCVRWGLLQRSPSSTVVGTVHQLVQRCLRDTLIRGTARGNTVLCAVRCSLCARFPGHMRLQPSEWAHLRSVIPSVESWLRNIDGFFQSSNSGGWSLEIADQSDDVELAMRLGDYLLYVDGNVAAACARFTQVLTAVKQIHQTDHPDIAAAMGNLAATYHALGRHTDAHALFEDVLAFMKRVHPSDHPDITTTMNNLALTYRALGRLSDALALQEDALAFMAKVHQADHPEIATARGNLAATYTALGRHTDALALGEDVLAFMKRVHPPDHPEIATVMGNLAATYHQLSQYTDALAFREEVLAFVKRVHHADHPEIATAMNNLAATYSALGRHTDALGLQEDVLAFVKRVHPPDHPEIATTMNNLAATYCALGRLSDALALQEDMLAFRKRVHPLDHLEIAKAMGNLAATHCALGRLSDARRLLKQAIEILVRARISADNPLLRQMKAVYRNLR